MFCPKCATQNIDGASFCRVCGANISLVPQALAGQPPVVEDLSRAARKIRKRLSRGPSIEHALKNAFTGVAFMLIALVLTSFSRGNWWALFMLIPAFSCLGQGVAEYIRYREEQKNARPITGYAPPAMAQPPVPTPLPARNTGELMSPPPSITEGTTRHLGAEAPTRHLDPQSDYQSDLRK
jgi:zinc-ribbon domain